MATDNASAGPGAPGRPRKSGPQTGDALREFVAEQVAEKINEQFERINEKVERRSAKVAKRAELFERRAAKAAKKSETLDHIAAHLGALDVWTRIEPAARRPRFTRDEIAAAATRIADTEGFDALSMRRLAAELDAGTMTLYHYVRTKDELLTLLTDAVMGEVVVPDDEPMPTDWRGALTVIAERSRAALQRHPWILDMNDDPPIGPNSVRHFDQSLQAVSSLPVSLNDKIDIVSTIDEYVFGYCTIQRNNVRPNDAGGDREMIAYIQGLISTGDYPHLSALADEIGLETAWSQIEANMRDPSRFARNLNRLLDGIEASLP